MTRAEDSAYVQAVPSPVGHALGGLLVAVSAPGAESDVWSRTTRRLIFGCIAAAVAPDLDFLWGRHNMETHSLGAAVLAGVCVWPWLGWRTALAVALSWSSHVLFDWLGSDTTPPIGIMALWPLTSEYYFAHAYFFEAISRRYHLPNFWSHNIGALVLEVVYLAPLILIAVLVRKRRARAG